MKSIIIFILKIPFYILKGIGKVILFIMKFIFGFLFGWIPDLDERMSGEEFEEYVQEVLIKNGYKKVCLTKKSGDYGVDILAEYKGLKYAIQCKFYARPVGVVAVQQAYAGAEYYECNQSVVVTNNHFTAQAIALAQTNHVELWDGDYLEQLKRKANSRSLFHRKKVKAEIYPIHPYQLILELFLNEGYASTLLLMENFHYSEEKSFYILEDLQFHELVSTPDHLGMRDLYFLSMDEALEQLSSQ